MKKHTFISLIKTPLEIEPIQTREVKTVIEEYPFFQSARAIYLKALKDLDSFRYNNELKRTAAYTTDRTILFDFITTEKFNKKKKNEHKNASKEELNSIIEISKPTEEKCETIKITEESLSIGKPLSFDKKDKHSFNEWLQLGNFKPIIRKEKSEKTEQENIIDNFIATNPKISKIDKNKPLEVKAQQKKEHSHLMTETLAKIYLEQKKYDSAIKAYEILSLKYPEKSGFFADRIKQIQILQKTK